MSILRSLIVLVVVIAGIFLILGYAGGLRTTEVLNRPDVASSGTVQRARQRGAEIGEKAGCGLQGRGDSR